MSDTVARFSLRVEVAGDANAAEIERTLAQAAVAVGGSLARVDHDPRGDYMLRRSRRVVVKNGKRQ